MRFPLGSLRRNQGRSTPITPEVLEAQAALLRAQQIAGATKVSAPVAPPPDQQPKLAPVPKGIDMGPYEKVVVFDRGETGVIWIAQLPRRILMEHVDIKARRLKEMRKARTAFLFGLLGLCFGVPLGAIFGFAAVLGGLVIISTLATLLISLVLGALAGIIPLAIMGYRRQGYAMWFVRRDGQSIQPVQHSTFDQTRFQGHIKVLKDEAGNARVLVPAGVKAQSASFVYHACRSTDWKGLWKGGQSKWARLNTLFFGVTALAALAMLFIVGYHSLQDSGGSPQPPSVPVQPTAIPEVRSGEATVGDRP